MHKRDILESMTFTNQSSFGVMRDCSHAPVPNLAKITQAMHSSKKMSKLSTRQNTVFDMNAFSIYRMWTRQIIFENVTLCQQNSKQYLDCNKYVMCNKFQILFLESEIGSGDILIQGLSSSHFVDVITRKQTLFTSQFSKPPSLGICKF